jgi:sigma-B regulation protein RsbU (phosphoserine phosphatase)
MPTAARTPALPPPELQEPPKPLMRTWKWVGLALAVAAFVLSRWLPSGVVAAGYLCGVVVVCNLLFHLFRRLKNYVLWSVRNRVIGSFVFVGLIPLVVLAGVVYFSLRVLLGQLTNDFLESSVRELEHELSWINAEMAQQIPRGAAPSALDAAVLRTFAAHAAQFPRLAARLARRRQDGTFETLWTSDPHGVIPRLDRYPAESWLGSRAFFEGLVGTKATMLLTSLRPVLQLPGHYLDVSAPVDANVEQRWEREKSLYVVFLSTEAKSLTVSSGYGTKVKVTTESGAKGNDRETEIAVERKLASLEARRKKDTRRMISWLVLADSRSLVSGEDVAGIAVVNVPLQVLYDRYLAGGSEIGRILLKLIYVLLGLFVVTEVVSVVVGATISRRITRSVHEMYQGTLALQTGDLEHRIPVRRNDQLGSLAHSFNQMSGSIVRLLEEVSEKKRLEQELSIAREVQTSLFPRRLPAPRGLSLFGGCEPARVVSGDYYDFVVEDESHLCIVVGDISGKGISAALMMANLQAAMRSQLTSIKHGSQAELEEGMAGVMRQLNRQIYENSPAEKYATVFVGRFDAVTRTLCYCNAGHLPPVVLDDDGVKRLEAGGPVLGLIPGMQYGARSIPLSPATVLAVFTDGVTEAVNGADEEFGEDRLIAAIGELRSRSPEEIYRQVLTRVQEWQGSLPQHDDITLIVAKVA